MKILKYGESVLKEKAENIDNIDEKIAQLVEKMRQTLLKVTGNANRSTRTRKASWLGVLAGLAAYLPRRSRSRVTVSEMRSHDFPTSTQRLGVRFTERIRSTFRFRWLNRP